MKIGAHLYCICFVIFSATYAYAENSVTFYRDGALYKLEATATKGVIDIHLPVTVIEKSLSISPKGGSTISTVKTRSEIYDNNNKELLALNEQKQRLADRLQALETRENIFTAAAKTQSGKAPRKTKNNPDPMQAIRQGTDFAIAQLEAVYTAKRKATEELNRVNGRIVTIKQRGNGSGSSVRIVVTPQRGTVTIRYATTEVSWQPEYSLHYDGISNNVRLQFSAKIPKELRGYKIHVANGTLAEAAQQLLTVGGISGDYLLPVNDLKSANGIFNSFQATITNNTGHYLTSGEATLFRNGSYLGKFRFEGISSGSKRAIAL